MKAAVVALAALATVFTGAVSAQAASMVEYGVGWDAKGEFSTQASCLAPQTKKGNATPKISMSVRKYPQIESPTCGSVTGNHPYEAACWVIGESHKGDQRWLRIHSDTSQWGYVPMANLYSNSFQAC
ncbi:hypothetical protein [Lentzea aerocolonigenes]|uniref:hypothetical protein n=1 Tax=Lentzea aerocolonigenes TaxID=68170 RepID=UPI000696C9DB|nr:hypothetical protein [Lentzea aerocolonigenes]